MKKEFQYWYPVDMRTSGKELIPNHLTMFLYNHVAIFDDKKKWPMGIFANGHVMVNGEKMSKSKGNFLILDQTIKTNSADATRIACADAGDGLDDANFDTYTANIQIIKLSNHLDWVEEILKKEEENEEEKKEGKEKEEEKEYGFFGKVFDERMKELINLSFEAYKNMRFRDALKYAWFDFQQIRDDYRVDSENKMNQKLLIKFIILQTIIMQPITPHISEHIWRNFLKNDKKKNDVASN